MKFNFKVIIFSVLAGILVWVSDAFLDHLFFSGKSFWDILILDVPENKLFIRILISLYFFIFGSVIAAYVNKQKKSTEKLQDIEFRYKTIAEKTNTWEFWKNTEGTYNYVSPAFERITGYLVEDLKQNPDLIKKIIHPDDLENVLKHFEDEVKNTLEISELEFKILTQNNGVKNIKHTCQPVYDNNGKFKGTRGSNIEIPERTNEHSKNISDLNQTKNDLQTSEQRFKAIFENTPDAFFLHDIKGTFIDCNCAAEELTGYKRNELIGNNYLKLKLLNISGAVKEVQLFAESAAGNPAGPEEFVINRKDDKKVSVEIRTFPVKIEKDTLVFSIVQDIRNRLSAERAGRQAEEILRQRERQLNESQKMARIGSWEWNIKTNVITWSEELYHLFGVDKDGFIATYEAFLNMIHPDDSEYLNRRVKATLQDGKPYNIDVRIVRPDGKEWIMLAKGEVVYDEQGKPAIMRGTAQDITNRRQTEETLHKSEAELNAIYQNAPLVMLLVDRERRVVKLNAKALSMARRSSEETIGLRGGEALHCVHSTDDPRGCGFGPACETCVIRNTILETFRTGEEFRCLEGINQYDSPDGQIDMNVLISTTLLKQLDEPLVLVCIEDTTESTLAKQSLQESENKYRTLFEKSADAILIIEGDKFVDCNTATVKMLGYTNKQELLDTHPSQLSPEMQPDGRNSFEKANEMMSIAYERGSHRFEWDHKRRNGEVFPVEVLLTYVPSGERNFIHVVWRDITERKKAEQTLIDNEKLLRESQKVANLGSYILDIPADIWESSFTLDDIFGIDKKFVKDVAGWLQIIHPEDREMMKDYFESNVLTNLESFNKEYRIKRINDKQERWVHGLGELEFDNEGNPIKMIGTIQDITERKRDHLLQNAVYQISEASDKAKSLDDLYKSVHDIIGTVMPANNFFIASYDDKKDLLGFDYFVDEIDDYQDFAKPGRGFTAYVLRSGKSLFLNEAMEKQLLETGEVENIGTSSPIWMGVPLIVENKTIGAMVVQHYSDPNAYSKDDLHLLEYVSSQIAKAIVNKRAEEELRKLSSAVKQSSAALVITDTQGNIEYVNPKFTKITGYTLEEVKGKSTNIMKSGESSPEQYKELWETITSGKEWRGEFHNKKKNGELYWDKSSISPIRDTEGSITHFLAVKEDITERKRIQQELIAAKEKAEEMNRLKSNFLANMSHELRTPLIGITGFAEILAEDIEDKEKKEMAETILQSGARLSKTLDLILDLSLLESDKLKLSKDKINIVDAVEESINSSRQLALKKGLEFNFERNGKEIYCNVDKNLLTRVVHYVLDNSIKFTYKGSVSVKVSSDGGAAIKIADTGVGIPEEKLKVIFEPFRQASEGNAREYEGAGLGLTIAKKFVDVLGGTVEVESQKDKGTIFTIKFPEVN